MTSKKRSLNIKSKERGITLITLVITIIVLLILAGVTLSEISGKGIIKNTKNAKEKAEILEEKETIQMAILFAKQVSQTGDIELSDIENAMKRVVDESRAAVVEDTDYTYIRFNDSNRHYTINNAEEIVGPVEIEGVPNAGDLTKGGEQKGTEEKPYIINCIEDLVIFSRDYATYESSYVILARTLNFKAVSSYNNYSTKEYGDLNGDGTVEELKTELTKQGDTCGGFTPIASFKGTFDGKNNKICNLYENRGEENAGLFNLNSGTIKNLGMENITLTGGTRIGGIVAKAGTNCTILNCYVKGVSTIKGIGGVVGLIVGGEQYYTTVVEDCYSIGEISIDLKEGVFAGIVGSVQPGKVTRCYNIMEIKSSTIRIGGIVGNAQRSSTIIEQCYHIGNIMGKNSGGIVNNAGAAAKIINCYNIGNIDGKGTLAGICGSGHGDCFNCYSVGEITKAYCCGIINGMNYGGHIVHCFGREEDFEPDNPNEIISYLSSYNNCNGYGHQDKARIGDECNVLTDDEMKEQDFVEELNTLIEADDEGEITKNAQIIWKIDENNINNGYPIFTWQE